MGTPSALSPNAGEVAMIGCEKAQLVVGGNRRGKAKGG